MTRDEILGSRILIVDDEPANVRLLEDLLQREGFQQVIATTDPLRVMGLVSAFAPDLILLDLKMPELDGYALLEQLARLSDPGQFLPVIVLTADPSRSARHHALGLGAKDFFDQTAGHLRGRFAGLERGRNHRVVQAPACLGCTGCSAAGVASAELSWRADELRLRCRALARPPSRDTLQVRACKPLGGIHAAKIPRRWAGKDQSGWSVRRVSTKQSASCSVRFRAFPEPPTNCLARCPHRLPARWTGLRRVPPAVRAPRTRPTQHKPATRGALGQQGFDLEQLRAPA